MKLWTEGAKDRIVLMSTLPGVHGETEATRVPRKTLTDALARIGTLLRTDDLANQRYVEVQCDAGEAGYQQVVDEYG